ncbi:MerR family transcriptional regulator [Furfurilactobacillus sp. WILCCON 0119]
MERIGAFSKRVHVSIDTLRYYEKLGLITPHRSRINQREYDDADATWMAFINRLKQTGMPMKQIQTYAVLRDQGDATIDQRLDLLAAQQRRLEREQQQIQAHLDFIDQKIETYHQRQRERGQSVPKD